MDYYHDLITEKSWKKLQELRRKYAFILIGGWAVYIHTKGLKSRDIDFICSYEELEKLRTDYDLIKNDRLRKYEVHEAEFDIDIYVPFFSELGIPVEELFNMSESVEGFTVLKPEPLLVLKQKAYENRSHSAKGQKDILDIFALLKTGVNLRDYKQILKKYELTYYVKNLENLLVQSREVPWLALSSHTYSKFKKSILKNLSE